LRYDVEWSFNKEAEVLIEFSLSWLLPFVSIDDIPLLVDTAMSVLNEYLSIVGVLSLPDIKYLSFNVDK
jgi:hypothetical protein